MLASSVRLLGAGSVLELAYDHDGILAADRLQPGWFTLPRVELAAQMALTE